ncbi:MAG TPA: sugar ABC transporter permease [Roseiflexaceae bacterium]|nr:sugar ABC transporter permease [Roseiflexaceae bacterium]
MRQQTVPRDTARQPATRPAGPRAELSLAARQARLAWLLLAPTLAVIVLVALYPLAQTLYLSLTNARLASATPAEFVGLENYQFLFQDFAFRDAVQITVLFTLITVTFEFLLGLLIALVINSPFRGRGPMRAAMLIPWAIPTVISAQMWKWMYNDVYGVINDLVVNKLHLAERPIAFVAADTTTALLSIAAVDIWKTTPFVALLLLAGLQVIPGDVYEAADVDGATRPQQFFRITLPLLRPAILVALIFRTLDALRVFDVFFVMFGARPDMQPLAVYAQQYLVSFSDLGYGSAICVAIFALIAVFVAMYVSIFRVEE